jgi:hypothetical protein
MIQRLVQRAGSAQQALPLRLPACWLLGARLCGPHGKIEVKIFFFSSFRNYITE